MPRISTKFQIITDPDASMFAVRYKLAEHRCPRCEIRKSLCFCSFIPRLTLNTKVVILMHAVEQVLPTNTAKLAHKALVNSEIRIHGRKDERITADCLHKSGHQSLILYPSPFARELTPEFVAALAGPVTLIVPDASWKQAQRFVRREPALAGIPHVQIPSGPRSEYRLRVQRREKDVCTLEAIARAIGILEDPTAQGQMELLLRVMVERTLWSRGRLSADRCVTAGIPPEAFDNPNQPTS